MTDHLRIVEKSKLGIFLAKVPDYRKARASNFNKAFAEIRAGLDNCIENLVSKTKHNANNFNQWKKIILQKLI